MAGPSRPMWTCPRCGRSYAIRNQTHACLDLSADQYLADKGMLARSIYESVVAALESCGEFRVHAQKTRIAFISRMSFAGISATRRWVDLSFILPAPDDDQRIRKLFLYGPTSWGHSVRIFDPGDVDLQVREWLRHAWRRGNQETLDSGAPVAPLQGRALELLETAFTGKVRSDTGELLVELPRYVAQALALVDSVPARARGVRFQGKLIRSEGSVALIIDPGAGVTEGGSADFYLG